MAPRELRLEAFARSQFTSSDKTKKKLTAAAIIVRKLAKIRL
jgi:hypothetical protein